MRAITMLEAFKLRKNAELALLNLKGLLETPSLMYSEYEKGSPIPEESLYRKKDMTMEQLLDAYQYGYTALSNLNGCLIVAGVTVNQIASEIDFKNAQLCTFKNIADCLRAIPDTRETSDTTYLNTKYIDLERLGSTIYKYQKDIMNLEASLDSLNASTTFSIEDTLYENLTSFICQFL